jgi:tryptophanyl-tRNA synthetase
MKKRIVSGIQPTGPMHIGNYLGALKDFVELQDKFDCYFFIADLHSLTGDFDPKKKAQQIQDLAETFLAVGLNPKKCTLFVQSQIPAHTELAWILNTLAPMGELERMTQYKDKAARQRSNINVGLFDYPVLQAADILIYKPDLVPVGSDQVQHLEFTNTLARKFNNKFGITFAEISPYTKKPLRIMSVADPEKKMSKSDPTSVINIFDSPETITKKLAKAPTATDAPKGTMPKGVENLFELLKHFGKPAMFNRYQKVYNENKIRYSELKEDLAKAIADYFKTMRKQKQTFEQNQKLTLSVFSDGAKKATKIASRTITEVKEKVGLL